jgi:hypothetical protein
VAGRHRAPRKRRWARALAFELAVAAAMAAAVLGAVSDDPAVLRGAIFGALAAAFIGSLLPRKQRPVFDAGADLRRLRAEVAELRGQLAALAPSPLAAAERPATLQLPLIRAALAASTVNGNGNGHANGNGHGDPASFAPARLIDLTTEPATALH